MAEVDGGAFINASSSASRSLAVLGARLALRALDVESRPPPRPPPPPPPRPPRGCDRDDDGAALGPLGAFAGACFLTRSPPAPPSDSRDMRSMRDLKSPLPFPAASLLPLRPG